MASYTIIPRKGRGRHKCSLPAYGRTGFGDRIECHECGWVWFDTFLLGRWKIYKKR